MSDQDTKRYLVIFHLRDSSAARLLRLIPRLQEGLGRLSKSPIEQAFRSVTADLFAYGITSTMAPAQLVAAIESPGRQWHSETEPYLLGDDHLMVMEIGRDFSAGPGFTRFGTWLQRH